MMWIGFKKSCGEMLKEQNCHQHDAAPIKTHKQNNGGDFFLTESNSNIQTPHMGVIKQIADECFLIVQPTADPCAAARRDGHCSCGCSSLCLYALACKCDFNALCISISAAAPEREFAPGCQRITEVSQRSQSMDSMSERTSECGGDGWRAAERESG